MLDLSFGNPEFLSEYWDNKNLIIDLLSPPKNYIYGSLNELKDSIKELHIKENNFYVDNKQIVIGNGATQLIVAIMSCLNTRILIEPPYYFRFKNMCSIANIELINNPPTLNKYIRLVTSPNNPDNKVTRHPHKEDILDLSYNWSIYTKTIKYNNNIGIFSFSKAFGLASTRIGWAFIKDDTLAKKVQDYIEYNTSGISIESQIKALYVIKNNQDIFDYGRKILQNRWEILKELNVPFKILNNSGMFAWCQGKCPNTINNINGLHFGDKEDKFRINIGCSKEKFDLFLEIINEYR